MLRALQPPLASPWASAAARMVSPLERRLLVLGAPPASVPAGALIRELALAKQSLTFDRRVRTMLHSPPEAALLREPDVLDSSACESLQRALDADASVRAGLTDGMPEHTLHLEMDELQSLIGHERLEKLMALPARYLRQAAAAAAAATSSSRTAQRSGEHEHAFSSTPPHVVEIFVRRFSESTRPWIKLHADVAALTVNVALTAEGDEEASLERGDAARGAGGRLLTVYDGAVQTVARRAGEATVHPSSLLHGVSRIHGEGTRYTLIAFFGNRVGGRG